MRLRNIPGAREEMLVNPYVIQNPRQYSGQFARCLFHNDNPLHIEIGTGKGQFLTGLARRSPDINYIGIDRYSSVLIKAVARQEQLELPNLRFLCEDAMSLPEIFGPGEVSRIYLNFPDPWPKDRHARRRLTSPEFLARYRLFLAEDGAIEFKTDNIPLFDYSIGSASGSGWRITRLTRDLHHSGDDADNIRTEYEERLSAQGAKVFALEATPGPEPEHIEQTASLSLIDYLPQDLEGLDYVPHGMQGTVTNLRNRQFRAQRKSR